jgi:hypothetical protein
VQDRVLPWRRLSREPVAHELRGARVFVEIAFCQSAGAHVDLADFPNGTRDVAVVPVDHEELDVDHAFAGGHDIFLGDKEGRILRYRWDGEVGYSALGLRRSVHVDDAHVGSESLQAQAVAFGEHISDEEGIEEGRDLARGLCRKQLTHGWGQMSNCDLAVGHPLCETSWSADIIGGGNMELGSKEKRREHCTSSESFNDSILKCH